MIFRKPYALLIKYFKLIHLALSVFMIYLIYKSSNIYNFFNSYVKSGWISLNELEFQSYITPFIYISILFIIFLSIIVFILMKIKNKPRLFYLLTPILYFLILILIITTNSTMSLALNDVINPVTTRVLRDIHLISIGAQFLFVIFPVLRSIGFDVKKFNFKQDIADLQIEDVDSEEVEVNIEIDKYKLGRKVKRRVRNYKYIFKENKFIIYSIISIIVLSYVGYFALNTFVFNPTYKENKTVELNKYNLIVNKSYITNKDYLGNEISKNYQYILVDFSIINNIVDNTFDIDKLFLLIDEVSYAPITNIYSDFIDIGNGYKDQILSTNNINRYYVVYKVPKNINKNKIILRYLNNISYDKNNNETYKYKKIKLNPVDSDKTITINKNLKEESSINGNLIKINEYSINAHFKYNYKICTSNTNCTDTNNYVIPKFNNSMILRLNIEGELLSTVNYSIKNMSYFFSTFGSITYVKDGKTYRQKNLSNLVSNIYNGKEVLLNVSSDIKDAEKINFEIKFRNINYSYKLK